MVCWVGGGRVLRVLLVVLILLLWGRSRGEGWTSVFGLVVARGCVLPVLLALVVVVAAWGLLRCVLWWWWWCLVVWRRGGLVCLLGLCRWRGSGLGELGSLELRLLR